MQSKVFLIAILALAVVGVGVYALKGSTDNKKVEEVPVSNTMPVPGSDVPEMVVENVTEATTSVASTVKEFAMTAYYDESGKWFSLKEMSVKKGDTVRVKVTNTKGMHDFVVDELGVKKELPLNEEVTVEFTADKVGDFVYYCSKPGHRAGGQWGTLKVTE